MILGDTFLGFCVSGKLLRRSVHSVRPAAPTGKLHHELHTKEGITQWRSLSDLREFTNITDEVPPPDKSSMIRVRRATQKSTLGPDD